MKNYIWALYKTGKFIAAYPSHSEAEQAKQEEHEGKRGVTIKRLNPPAS